MQYNFGNESNKYTAIACRQSTIWAWFFGIVSVLAIATCGFFSYRINMVNKVKVTNDDYYKTQVDRLAADGIAVFHGFQNDPRPYYAAADCVVLPSYHEGMSNVLLEAAATGRPVITSDIPGCREAVEDGKTGALCKVKDADSLYAQMSRMAAAAAAERQAMGRAGHEKMAREFAKQMVIEKTQMALV